ncbi:GntR family transcriptional regulator [Tessaracoccus oleiagri]|nr:GntR family transcriptional regulator [Tessaracoccus oleiagri]
MKPETSPAPLQAIEFSNLRGQVLKVLRDSIITGAIPQGSALVETRLAGQLNVSRGTVREALLELQQQQLVEATSNGRLHVRALDAQKVYELFTVRAALEGLAARLIAEHPDRGSHQETLRQRLAVMSEQRDGPIVDLIDADLAFHRTLVELAGNAVLQSSWLALEGPLRMAIMHAGADRARANITVEKHRPFIDALDVGVKNPADVIYRSLTMTAETLVGPGATEEDAGLS